MYGHDCMPSDSRVLIIEARPSGFAHKNIGTSCENNASSSCDYDGQWSE